MPVLVRVPSNEPISIGHALDAGAEGVIVPMISTVGDARRAADASHYPPLGYRSWGPLRAGMAQPGFDTYAGNAQVICIAMITRPPRASRIWKRSSPCRVLTGCSSAATTWPSRTPDRSPVHLPRGATSSPDRARPCASESDGRHVPAWDCLCTSGQEDARRWEGGGSSTSSRCARTSSCSTPL